MQCSGHTEFAPAHGCVCFPRLHCSVSRLLYMERALHCMWFQFSGIPQKQGLSCTCVFCFPRPSGSGSQALDGRTLPGCGAPSPPRGPSLFPPAPVRCVRLVFSCDPRRMSTIQNLRKSLVRNWRPVCSVVGDAVSGAKFAPFPFPLPPASCLQQGWAGLPQASSSMVFIIV